MLFQEKQHVGIVVNADMFYDDVLRVHDIVYCTSWSILQNKAKELSILVIMQSMHNDLVFNRSVLCEYQIYVDSK